METIRETSQHGDGVRERQPNDYHHSYRRGTTTDPSEVSKNSPGDMKASGYKPTPRPPVPPFSPPGGRFRPLPTKLAGKHLQSVVTSSFSVEDTTLSPDRFHVSSEHRETSEAQSSWAKNAKEERSLPPPSIVVTNASPRSYGEQRQASIARSYSATTVDSYNSLPMKRNYFHHAQSSQSFGGLPPDFIPPKRSKAVARPPQKSEVVLAARSEHEPEARHWYGRPSHWGYPEESHMRSQSFESSRWIDQKHPESPIAYHPHSRYGPPSGQVVQMSPRRLEESPSSWRRSNWYAYPPPLPPSHYWASRGQEGSQDRDDIESRHSMAMQREMRESFDEDMSRDSSSAMQSNRHAIFRHTSTAPPRHNHASDKMKLVMEAASFTESRDDFARASNKSVSFSYDTAPGSGMILAMPEDKVSLSETLCVVREVCSFIEN